ncbi:hypothetical protein BU26DRAFT_259609 [Trematosphaeria pertusa]|uniref:Uncharacterized protein n=1 Tax=Trematosphaeria pertusa TaxID=390896 RepID=A0A6A6IR81_9PLEO|nr:uncharacterized protein BU26DRAFT_259609 [Trematosphaeria pertusa]KAF2252588.1 hypothetical protein BU26DRAFT_259609 [Trematosphaeria pertusa]
MSAMAMMHGYKVSSILEEWSSRDRRWMGSCQVRLDGQPTLFICVENKSFSECSLLNRVIVPTNPWATGQVDSALASSFPSCHPKEPFLVLTYAYAAISFSLHVHQSFKGTTGRRQRSRYVLPPKDILSYLLSKSLYPPRFDLYTAERARRGRKH